MTSAERLAIEARLLRKEVANRVKAARARDPIARQYYELVADDCRLRRDFISKAAA